MQKTMMVLFTLAAVGLAQPASARGGGGGHGGHGGGFHGGGFHGGGFHGRGFIGFGFGPYAYDDGYYPYDEDVCYVARQRVKTRHGWRVRLIDVCQ